MILWYTFTFSIALSDFTFQAINIWFDSRSGDRHLFFTFSRAHESSDSKITFPFVNMHDESFLCQIIETGRKLHRQLTSPSWWVDYNATWGVRGCSHIDVGQVGPYMCDNTCTYMHVAVAPRGEPNRNRHIVRLLICTVYIAGVRISSQHTCAFFCWFLVWKGLQTHYVTGFSSLN